MKRKETVSIEVAQEELNRWFEACRFKEKKILSNRGDEDQIETIEGVILDSICEGLIVVDEQGVLTQKLEIPFKEKDSLTYKARLTVNQIRQSSVGVKGDDSIGRLIATVAARTGENKGLISQMDMTDFDISSAIIAYFL